MKLQFVFLLSSNLLSFDCYVFVNLQKMLKGYKDQWHAQKPQTVCKQVYQQSKLLYERGTQFFLTEWNAQCFFVKVWLAYGNILCPEKCFKISCTSRTLSSFILNGKFCGSRSCLHPLGKGKYMASTVQWTAIVWKLNLFRALLFSVNVGISVGTTTGQST